MRRVVRVCLFLLVTTGSMQAGPLSDPGNGAALPDAGASLLRVAGALIFVVALFLTGVWAFRRAQTLRLSGTKGPRLQVLDVKSLGNRQALYVVGFEQQRLLIGASPTGVQLLTRLEDAPASGEFPSTPPTPISFPEALQQAAIKRAQ